MAQSRKRSAVDLDANGKYPPVTRHIRVSADLADMLAWISRLKRLDTGRDWRISDFVDPFVRPQVEAEYARIAERVEKIKDAMAEEGNLPDED